MSGASKGQASSDTLATNRKARRDYHVIEQWEAGLALTGPEVKSCRAREVSLDESFARFEGHELMLVNAHIKPYAWSRQEIQEPARPRRLLLHKRESVKLIGQMARKGLALIPLRLYLNARGRIKVALALCKGKHTEDKREDLKARTARREADRAIRAAG